MSNLDFPLDQPSNHPSIPKLGLIYAAVLLGLLVLVSVVQWIAETFFHLSDVANSVGVLVPFLAAMQTGSIYFKKTGLRPSGSFCWKAAAIFSLISSAFTALLMELVLVNGLMPELDGYKTDPNAITIILGIHAAIFVLWLLLARLGFGWGLRQGERLKEARGRKGA
ncbi:MAG: ABZJ_00895 family protein [Hyphomicrobiaceae bacterium]